MQSRLRGKTGGQLSHFLFTLSPAFRLLAERDPADLGERVRVILAGTVLSFKRAASNHPTQASPWGGHQACNSPT